MLQHCKLFLVLTDEASQFPWLRLPAANFDFTRHVDDFQLSFATTPFSPSFLYLPPSYILLLSSTYSPTRYDAKMSSADSITEKPAIADSDVNSVEQADIAALEKMGYRQEFKREFTNLSVSLSPDSTPSLRKTSFRKKN
jgi:hypothetical protein